MIYILLLLIATSVWLVVRYCRQYQKAVEGAIDFSVSGALTIKLKEMQNANTKLSAAILTLIVFSSVLSIQISIYSMAIHAIDDYCDTDSFNSYIEIINDTHIEAGTEITEIEEWASKIKHSASSAKDCLDRADMLLNAKDKSLASKFLFYDVSARFSDPDRIPEFYKELLEKK